MPAKLIKRKNACPYWSSDVKKCQISGGGLFIPQDDHTDVYCTTAQYPQCLQYVLYSEHQLDLIDQKNKLYRNRRKYTRINAEHRITLDKILAAGDKLATIQTVARTLDLGIGGMRLAIDFPLENSALVQVYFDDSFPEDLQSATGMVTWCNKQIDEPGYHAGISFKSYRVIKAMGEHLRR